MTLKTIVALALAAASASAAAGQINKCVDASGKVVGYGDCQPGTRSETSKVTSTPAPPRPSSGTAAAGKSPAEQDAEYRKRQIEKREAEDKSAKKQAATEQNQRACEQSRAYLKSLQDGNRITRTDPKTGERIFLQDSEYASEITRTQATIQQNCR